MEKLYNINYSIIEGDYILQYNQKQFHDFRRRYHDDWAPAHLKSIRWVYAAMIILALLFPAVWLHKVYGGQGLAGIWGLLGLTVIGTILCGVTGKPIKQAWQIGGDLLLLLVGAIVLGVLFLAFAYAYLQITLPATSVAWTGLAVVVVFCGDVLHVGRLIGKYYYSGSAKRNKTSWGDLIIPVLLVLFAVGVYVAANFATSMLVINTPWAIWIFLLGGLVCLAYLINWTAQVFWGIYAVVKFPEINQA
ncbi:hypothetical protein [Lacticaseibacillus nasuensis]|uniref:hypothetical protein n=1 Tax=Lacticaseibacillus nasuensis TaxID=944671 RepID=UPI0022457427|nr:hypothetical protein [Lacticaseibacillus nasuensis]MCX2456031.1 hypothetical protein [Lacticaseibacillus nasuensis]